MSESWRSFWYGTIAAIIIAVVAGVFFNEIEVSSGEKFSTSSTRLGE